MGIVIQERPSSFSGGALQMLGQIGSSALDTVVNGIANFKNGESIHKHLKLFNSFEENSNASARIHGKELKFSNAAEYGNPAQVLKDFAGSVGSKDSSYKELLKKIEDPKFKVSDGLARFAAKQIPKAFIDMAPSGAINGLYAHVENRRGVFHHDSKADRLVKLENLQRVVQEQLDLFHLLKIKI
jgi:hypothetical protein